jgi:hypothetical protein
MNICSQLRRAACAIALAACAATPGLAKDSGFYLGVDIGQSSYDIDEGPSGLFQSSTGAQTDDTDTSFALTFGYRINPYVGVEFGYSDLGNSNFREYGGVTVTKTAPPTPLARPAFGFLDTSAGASGASLSVIGSLPVQKLELFGRVGAIYAESRVDTQLYSTSIDTPSTAGTTVCPSACTWAFPNAGSYTDKAETTEMLFGVGVGYTFAEVLFVKVEFSRISKLGDENTTGESDVDNLSLGFHYRF